MSAAINFEKPLLDARLLRRYKRFLADVELEDGTVLTVHCANSGAMIGCAEIGQPVVLSDSQNPKRKLRYTWEMILIGETWVGVNTATPNGAVAGFVARQQIPELAGYGKIKREVKVSDASTSLGKRRGSRLDLLLSEPESERPDCYVEIKNATLRVGEHAAFPDAVTTRGRKHLDELARLAKEGHRAVIYYFVGRADCRRMRPADEIDPDYGAALRLAVDAGVEPLAYRMRFSRRGVELVDRLPVDL